MNKNITKGVLVGIIAPIAAYFVYVAFGTEGADPIQMYHQLVAMQKISHALSLSVLINLLLFFMKLKTNRDDQAKGVLFATFIYAFIIVILKLI